MFLRTDYGINLTKLSMRYVDRHAVLLYFIENLTCEIFVKIIFCTIFVKKRLLKYSYV